MAYQTKSLGTSDIDEGGTNLPRNYGYMKTAIIKSLLSQFSGFYFHTGLPQAGLAICARFFVNMSFNTIMQWSTEVLPTPVRASGTSMMHVSGFAGGLISPFVVYSVSYRILGGPVKTRTSPICIILPLKCLSPEMREMSSTLFSHSLYL